MTDKRTQMRALKLQARERALHLGHLLGPWEDYDPRHPRPDMEIAAVCLHYGCCARVVIQNWEVKLDKRELGLGLTPRPRSYGTAVGVRCRGTAEEPRKPPAPWLPDDKLVILQGIAALRTVLTGLRWHSQNGYPSYHGDGKWAFVSTGLPQVPPGDLNALFALAQIEPDVIKRYGACGTCRYSDKDGNGRGYGPPCAGCPQPAMLNYEPRERVR